jgi:hypothetical protein
MQRGGLTAALSHGVFMTTVFKALSDSQTISVNSSSDRAALLDVPEFDGVLRLNATFGGFVRFGDSGVVSDADGIRVNAGIEYLAIPRSATHIAFFIPGNNGDLIFATGLVS